MSILKRNKPACFEIGKNGTTAKFNERLTQAMYTAGTADNVKELLDGAMQAFCEGRPENIQTAVLKAQAGGIQYYPATGYTFYDLGRAIFTKLLESNISFADMNLSLATIPAMDRKSFLEDSLSRVIFSELAENNNDQQALINSVLLNIPEQDKKTFLNGLLNQAVEKATGGETFLSLLLKSGAEANAGINGHAGAILAIAASNKAPLSVVKLLHDNGASFDDALAAMHSSESRKYSIKDLDSLELYRDKITGKSAAASVADQSLLEEATIRVLETMQLMQEQISDLTAEVKDLKSLVGDFNANQPKKTKPPVTKKIMPVIKGPKPDQFKG